jgi:hypothetical protein
LEKLQALKWKILDDPLSRRHRFTHVLGSNFHKFNGNSPACVILCQAHPNKENVRKIIQIFRKKRMFTLLLSCPGIFRKTCRQLVIERKGYFPICIENQAIIFSFAQDECKHTRMADMFLKDEE